MRKHFELVSLYLMTEKNKLAMEILKNVNLRDLAAELTKIELSGLMEKMEKMEATQCMWE